MNKWIGMGRLTKDPEVRYSAGDNPIAIARYTVAIDRRKTQNNEEPGADFISCIAFGKAAEFAEKYLKKGTKIAIAGRIQTGHYTNQEGKEVYTTDIIVEETEFAESKRGMSEEDKDARDNAAVNEAGFMNIPDGIEEELPFS